MIKFEKYLESQSKRDQIALFVIFFIVVIFSWNGLLREPLAKEIMVQRLIKTEKVKEPDGSASFISEMLVIDPNYIS